MTETNLINEMLAEAKAMAKERGPLAGGAATRGSVVVRAIPMQGRSSHMDTYTTRWFVDGNASSKAKAAARLGAGA